MSGLGIICLPGNGHLDITGNANINNDGSLTGFGAIVANPLTNDSLINPSNNTGKINLTGNYTQTANADLNMDISGTNSGEFDQLLITGTANLNGDLNISLVKGYTPTLGDTIDILTFGDQASPATSWSAKDWHYAIALVTLPPLTPRL